MKYTQKQVECADCVLKNLENYFSLQKFHDTALAFSGGLDSTLLLKISNGRLRPYTLGTASSIDVRNARYASALLDVPLMLINLERVDISHYMNILVQIDPSISRLDLSFELVLAVLLDNIKERIVFTGQGADELFYGYSRFRDQATMDNRREMDKLMNVTLPREEKIAEYFGKDLRTPYLSAGMQECLQDMSKEDHMDAGQNKIVLRVVADRLKLPEGIVSVPKKAAQYGSGMSKILKAHQWQA